jgi:type VI secretion system protein ImpM
VSDVAVAEPPVTRFGFHGKIPSTGDFITRRLSRRFIDRWDGWLQQAIARSRDQLGEGWLDAYLTSPVWRFALSAGLVDEPAMAGVLMPSVDRVGRYFPLTLALPLPAGANPARLLGSAPWLDELEGLALSVLEQDVAVEQLDERVAALAAPAAEDLVPPADTDQADCVRFGFRPEQGPGSLAPDLADMAFRAAGRTYSLWWTVQQGGDEPSLLVCRDLPPADAFAALLDGQWRQWGWTGGADVDGILEQAVV